MKSIKNSFLPIISILLFLSLSVDNLHAQNDEPLKMMTFNIRYDNTMDTLNPWTVRKDWVVQLLKKYNANIVGLQEALNHQMEYIEEHLPQYNWVGVGRDDGKKAGEYVSILYKKEQFELLEHNHFWLSKTPEQAGSKSWRALPRMVTWAKLKDKTKEEVFFVFNTHFDHHSRKARRKSARLLLEYIPNIAGENFSIVLGDFNALPHTKPYLELARTLEDTHHLSEDASRSSVFTFHGFGSKKSTKYRTIDYIFITDEQKMRVLKHTVIIDEWKGKYPSDHFPVMATMGWK
ncbi:MAG: endonuclease/exonuclease/phosphatase family protein [Chitinophagales bacterium]